MQLCCKRTWFFIPFAVGGLKLYIGRDLSGRQSPPVWTLSPYLLQTLFLLLVPALLAAPIYILLGRIIFVLRAESHFTFSKKWLTKTFVKDDVLSFFLQGAGGGIQTSGSLEDMKNGEHIIVGGISVQIFFCFFLIKTSAFDLKLRRYPIPRCHDSTIPWRKHLKILYATSSLIMIRSVLRLAEIFSAAMGIYYIRRYIYTFSTLSWF
ncbi:unnamed protein product [Penicillium nalgiovense]|nr:unnamed protein product [Penicillium nalgiovense]